MILVYLSLFFGGAFFANAIPHFIQGISGNKFPTPFAKPPGLGNSSTLVNVLWGTFNFVVSYLLLLRVADLDLHEGKQVLVVALGAIGMAIMLAHAFGPKRENYWQSQRPKKS